MSWTLSNIVVFRVLYDHAIRALMTTAIDPDILLARQKMAAATGPFDIMALRSAEGRALLNAAAAILNDGLPDMARIEDHEVGDIRVRIYTPHGAKSDGFIYYLHGGGWFACNVDTHDRMLRMLAERTGAVLFSPDYRLAPEHPYPTPLDDCAAAWDWIEAEANRRGLGDRFAFGGDSAGGNMSLALTMRLRDAGRAIPQGCALLYGCFAPDSESASARRFGQGGFGLTAERMLWYWKNYLGDATAVEATPLHAPLFGLPPIYLGVAEADTVADDSRALYDRLIVAGVAAKLKVWPGAVHGFLQMTRDVALARDAIDDVAHAIRNWIA